MSEPIIKRAPMRVQQVINETVMQAIATVKLDCPGTASWLEEKSKGAKPDDTILAIIESELNEEQINQKLIQLFGEAFQKLRAQGWADEQIKLAIERAQN